ncbi:MAG: histidine kinase [FCB group bacterium]|nr:histidine kinase [FCB group bacterium]MBL7027197.1 histidine kinase [Candidatus Neomarinimicrobiota bacterium]MBL7120568.1 histidine kinase [Candidatus Neomarinimicrobiota bacterium]
MLRKWIEPVLLMLLFGVAYFSPIQSATRPVFYGEFNNLDGSLYAVRIFDMLISIVLVMLVARILIPKRLNIKSLLQVAGLFLGLLLVSSGLEWAWDQMTLRVFNLPTAPGEVSDKMLLTSRKEILNLTILSGNVLVMVGGIFYGLMRERNQQMHRQERLELENLAAEVKYLRSQINPHFLFNTLNNIYAITQRHDDHEGSDALLRLSGLMRYMLYDSEGDLTALQKEIDHLQDYMDLMLLKYSSDSPPEVELVVKGSPDAIQVAPLLLLPFVENAFKHGIDNQGKGWIHILLNMSSEKLSFAVENSHFQGRNASTDHKGIGLENVKRRLEHHYPERHNLSIDESEDEYGIKLEIQL